MIKHLLDKSEGQKLPDISNEDAAARDAAPVVVDLEPSDDQKMISVTFTSEHRITAGKFRQALLDLLAALPRMVIPKDAETT